MAGEFSGCFQELREEFDRVTGKRNGVKINGKFFPAIVEGVTFDPQITGDGNGEGGGFTAQVAIADCPRQPEANAEIEANGQKLSILSVEMVNGSTWVIVAGDIAIE